MFFGVYLGGYRRTVDAVEAAVEWYNFLQQAKIVSDLEELPPIMQRLVRQGL